MRFGGERRGNYPKILTDFLEFSEEKCKLLAKEGVFRYNRNNRKWRSVAFSGFGAEGKKEESL